MPAIRGSAFASSGPRTTSCTVTIDAAVQADDIIVLDVVNRDSTSAVTVADDDAGGNAWALEVNQAASANGSGQRWWKRATSGTAGKTITVSGATGSVACVGQAYSDCVPTGNPFGSSVGEANASGDETQAGITTTRNSSWVLFLVACTSNDSLNPNSFTATSPSTLTERGEGTSTGGADCSVTHASAEKSPAGPTGDISWLQTNGTGASVATELLAPITLGDDSDSFASSVYSPAIIAAVLAAELAATGQASRAVAITGGDREEIPAGFVLPIADDGYCWTPVIQDDWAAKSPFYDAEEWPTPPPVFVPEDDYQLPVIQWPPEPWHPAPPSEGDHWALAPLIDGDFIVQPRWPGEWLARQAPEQGHDFISPPVLDDQARLPTPVWPIEWRATTGHDLGIEMVAQPPPFTPDEWYWQRPPACVTAPNFVFYPPDRGEPAAEEPDIWTPDPVDTSQTWTPADS